MTLSEFLNEYEGKKVEFDGVFGPQCMDLFRQYHKDVVGGDHTGGVEGAADLWEGFSDSRLREYYHRFNLVMAKPGDVVIFGRTKTNRYGHVAIFLRREADGLLVFEQDGFRQDGAKYKTRSDENVLGILRPIKEVEI